MKRKIFDRSRTWLIGMMMVVAWSPAIAVDGVIEINDVRAQAGGISPGDTPGYPVTLDQPGSYRLTGQLFVSGTNLNVVEITADHVVLDLNGFSIRCLAAFETCVDQGGNGIGIRSTGLNVEIRNGTVRDMPLAGLYVTSQTRVQGVRAVLNGLGIHMDSGVIEGCSIENNVGDGISLGVAGGFSDGIVRDSKIVGNGGDGIDLYVNFDGALILSNVILGNGGYGIRNGSGRSFAYGHNSIRLNTLGEITDPTGAIQTAGNLCGTSSCP